MAATVSGIYKNFSEATLETMLSAAQTIAGDIERISEWESEQTRSRKQFAISFETHLAEINYALSLKDNTTYRRITRTVGQVYNG